MHQIRFAGVLAAACLLLAACASSPEVGSDAEVQPGSGSSSAPDRPEDAPRPDPADPVVPVESEPLQYIGLQYGGFLALGTDLTEAATLIGADTTYFDEDYALAECGWMAGTGDYEGLSVMVENDTVVAYSAWMEPWQSPSGVRIGDPERVLIDTYGTLQGPFGDEHYSYEYVPVAADNEGLVMVFSVYDGVVTGITAGIAGPARDGCAPSSGVAAPEFGHFINLGFGGSVPLGATAEEAAAEIGGDLGDRGYLQSLEETNCGFLDGSGGYTGMSVIIRDGAAVGFVAYVPPWTTPSNATFGDSETELRAIYGDGLVERRQDQFFELVYYPSRPENDGLVMLFSMGDAGVQKIASGIEEHILVNCVP